MTEPAEPKSDPKATAIRRAFARHADARGPKYLALHAAVIDSIEEGRLLPGARLPAEDQLARDLGISVGTVRQAMQALSADGMLERRHGAGTFIADQALNMHDLWHFCFLAEDGIGFMPLRAKAIHVGPAKSNGPWRDHMPDAPGFVWVRRIIEVGDAFRLLSDFYFDGGRFGSLADQPKSAFDRVVLRNLLIELYGVRLTRAPQHLRCAAIAAAEAKLLKVTAGEPGMALETFGADTRGQPAYYQKVIIPRTDRPLVIDR